MSKCLAHSLGEVNSAIQQHDGLQKVYGGGYLSTELDNIYITPGCFIIILVMRPNDPSVGHFIAAEKTKTGELRFFDSLAIHPLKHGLQNFINVNTKDVYYYSNIKAQSNNSSCCAYFSLFFACKRFLNNMDFKNILKIFQNNSCEENEKLVYNYVQNIFCFN